MLAGVHAALFIASLVAGNGLSDASWPLPGSDTRAIGDYFLRNARWVQVTGMLQFAAAVPVAIYAATVSSRLSYLGVRAAGTTIALVGGTIASMLLAIAGLGVVTAGATADSASPEALAVLHHLIFAVGGAGAVVFLGLLVAGVAVPSRMFRFLPQRLCWAALAVAGVSELATLALAVDPLAFLIPIGRLGSIIVLIAAGVLLPTARSRASS